MRGTLVDEVARFFDARGPSTATEVALGVRARREDIDVVLAGERFARVPRPEGGSPRAVYFCTSEYVLRAPRGISVANQTSDKEFLLAVLRDGRWHSLSEILSRSFADRGCGLTVHSRASDLRRHDGYTIEQRGVRTGGRRGSEYRLVGRAEARSIVDATSSASRPDDGAPVQSFGSSSERQRNLFGEAA